MSNKTGIEWTDSTWSPVRGCSRVSKGCKNCYAEKVAYRFSGEGQPYEGLIAKGGQWNGNIKLVEHMLDQPLRWKKPRRIFVNSMSDLFHEKVPYECIDKVFAVMALAPQHTFQVLTKRPERMLEYFNSDAELSLRAIWGEAALKIDSKRLSSVNPSFPLSNVWLGVSVEDQKTADERIPLLLQTPAAVRWISAEPLLGEIDLTSWIGGHVGVCGYRVDPKPLWLDWVVVGGESGKDARPMHHDWVKSLRDQCQAAEVPFLFKQWGEWLPVCAQYPETKKEEQETEEASLCGDICFNSAGYICEEGIQPSVSGRPWLMDKAGKKKAGRTLDGRTWDEYPA